MKYNFCCVIEKKDRLDLYLTKIFPDFSRSYVQKIIDSGQVQVNSKIIKKNAKNKSIKKGTTKLILYFVCDY